MPAGPQSPARMPTYRDACPSKVSPDKQPITLNYMALPQAPPGVQDK